MVVSVEEESSEGDENQWEEEASCGSHHLLGFRCMKMHSSWGFGLKAIPLVCCGGASAFS